MTIPTNTETITCFFFASLMLLFGALIQPANAQNINPGVDLYSTYVWRGVAYSGPSIQPYIEFSTNGFAIGAWGSQAIDGITSSNEASTGFQEMDLYTSYRFDFGLSLGITDYYYPGTPFFSYTSAPDNGDISSHAVELNGGYVIDDFSLSANYIVNESPGGAGSAGGDMYYQIGYAPGSAELFIGGGDGWHTSDGDFKIVNIGIGAAKEIVVTERFSLPLSGAAILNPYTEQFYIVVGLSL
ncbi:TorF family putative porin [Fodinibius sediminis]|uniref:Uncharacterized protein n=1 Tax=Fodinibius sediminis TaxID=1214077 RepID=A0A521E7W9_9BACT|nr:TorF family putative porin [Fodinibius sediminis]SMO79260.1 protein of unknown function (Gcw_chp) [Fodinibius sediminis]